ncbi:MAG: FapA family protein [Candidatus Hydrogenedentes bacterium]|nr:FapA family protein [Candidatus Hydrogenedentota bacterium]
MDETAKVGLSVRVSADSLSVVVDCVVTEANVGQLVELLSSELVVLKVVSPPDRDRLISWLVGQVSEHGPVLKEAVVVKGVAPVAPVDGLIEWAGSFFDSGFVIDETTGVIDYRQRAAQHSVQPGQLLAKIKLPVPGVDGQDVFGRRIRAPLAKAALIRTGENVRKEEAEGSLYAVAGGRVRWGGNTLSVDKVCVVEGSVGMESGNVDHPGAVEVMQDVLEDASVKAKGDVEVRQVVEHADIETGGTLTVRGGISGGGTHKVAAAGSVHARYILDAHVEAGQDVVVEREVVHSNVKTRGALVMPKGRLIGGETVALHGGVIGQISSPALVATTFVAGEDFRLSAMLEEKGKAVAQLNGELAQLENGTKTILGRVATLPPEAQAKLDEMQKQSDSLKNQIEGLNGEIQEIRQTSEEATRYAVEVRGMIYPEAIFCMGRERLRVQKEIPGPVRVCLLDDRIQVIPIEKG